MMTPVKALDHLQYKLENTNGYKISKRDKIALNSIGMHLTNEKKENVSYYQSFFKMYLTLLRITLSTYPDINIASKRLHSVLKTPTTVLLKQFLSELNNQELKVFSEHIGLENEVYTEIIKPVSEEQQKSNLEKIKSNQENYLKYSSGFWNLEDVVDNLEHQFLVLTNIYFTDEQN